jgi:V-type H+-transporting ATPase subunit A
LQQNSFSKTDYNCPMYKTMGMMKAIVKFHENCIKVLEATARQEQKLSMAYIESKLSNDIIFELTQMKFQLPTKPEQEIRTYFDRLHEDIDKKFTELQYAKSK